MIGCGNLHVPPAVIQHVVHVEPSFNPYAIGVVKERLTKQPRNLQEALQTVRMLEAGGYNFSVGIAQVNQYSLKKYGLGSYEKAFDACSNLLAGSKTLKGCYISVKNDWGKAFSCHCSGDFITGYGHGYVQKIFDSTRRYGNYANTVVSNPNIQIIDLDKSKKVFIPNGDAVQATRYIQPKDMINPSRIGYAVKPANSSNRAVTQIRADTHEPENHNSSQDSTFVF